MNDVNRSIKDILITSSSSEYLAGITQDKGIYISNNHPDHFDFDKNQIDVICGISPIDDYNIDWNNDLIDCELKHINSDLIHIIPNEVVEENDNFWIKDIDITNLIGGALVQVPTSDASSIINISLKYPDRTTVSFTYNEDFDIGNNYDGYTITGSTINSGTVKYVFPSQSSILLPPIEIFAPDSILLNSDDWNIMLGLNNAISAPNDIVCLKLDDGIEWDLSIPYIQSSYDESVNGRLENMISNLSDSQNLCLAINETFYSNDKVIVEGLYVLNNNAGFGTYNVCVSNNHGLTCQDQDEILTIVDFDIYTDSENLNQSFFINILDTAGIVDLSFYKLDPIKISPNSEHQFYNSDYGLIIRIPLELKTSWLEGVVPTITIGNDTYDVADYEINDRDMIINLGDEFDNVTNGIILNSLYFDNETMEPSQGMLKFVLDGANNELQLEDEQMKVIADKGIYLSNDEKYMLHDYEEYAVLPNIKLIENQVIPVLDNSIIELILPFPLKWNENSLIEMVINNNPPINLSNELYEIDSDKLRFKYIEFQLGDTISIQNIQMDTLNSVIYNQPLYFTISNNVIPDALNGKSFPSENTITVSSPILSLNRKDYPVKFSNYIELDGLNLIDPKNNQFFDLNHSLIFNLPDILDDYLSFNIVDSVFDFYELSNLGDGDIKIDFNTDYYNFNKNTIGINGINLIYDKDYCELTDDDYELLIEGLGGELKFKYQKNNNAEIRSNYNLGDTIIYYIPSILDTSIEMIFNKEQDLTEIYFHYPEILELENDVITPYHFLNNDLIYENLIINFNSKEDDYQICADKNIPYGYFTFQDTTNNNPYLEFSHSIYSANDNNDVNIKISSNRELLFGFEDKKFNSDKVDIELGYTFESSILESRLVNADNLCTISINSPYSFVDNEVSILISDITLGIIVDTVLSKQEMDNGITLCDLTDHNFSGIYTIEMYLNSTITFNLLKSRSSFAMPYTEQVFIDNSAPIMYSDKNYFSKKINGYGHEYFIDEEYSFAITDNIITTNDTLIFLDNGQIFLTKNYLGNSNIIEIKKTTYLSEDYNFVDSSMYLLAENDLIINQNVNQWNDIGLIKDMFDGIIDTNSKEIIVKQEITLKDASGMVSDTTLYLTIVNNTEKLLSDDYYNYPNPFKAIEGTSIRLLLNDNIDRGRLIILDSGGELILSKKFNSALLTRGTHYIHWNGKDMDGDLMATGTYFAFIEIIDEIYAKINLLILN
ncbi:MAG: hypothetical protein H8E55_17295 [Pelagibacterales bacterium]|nr:hypothetical protein [Pelagibacterales bacterium]